MSKNLNNHYNQIFYDNQVDGSSASASIILKHLFEHYRPNSMLDIGCGRGAWLDAAERLGVKTIHGIDGPWVKSTDLLSNSIVFNAVNMETEIPVNQKYDLSISVEVAEHLSARRAGDFVGTLCKGADVVLFGAAVPCQGGENHINEQRQSYWLELFAARGFRSFDIIRGKIWNDPKVSPWYRQNTLIYVNTERKDLLNKFESMASGFLVDVIHPDMFENRVNSFRAQMLNPTARMCVGMIKSYLFTKLGVKNKA